MPEEGVDMYQFGIEVLDEAIGGISPGANLLIIGPPMTGKSFLVRQILKKGLNNGEAGILITTKDTGELVTRWFRENGVDIEGPSCHCGIVDCVSKTLRMDTQVKDTEKVLTVSSPVDLTGISVRVNDLLERFWMKEDKKKIRIVIESLSTLLMYSNIQTVFRFLHVFTGRVRSADAVGLYTVEDGMHDPQAIITLKQLVQGIVEIKEEENKHFLRVTGLTSAPTQWYEYKIDGQSIALGGF
jgi:KaiC/GvpD/RAD55 family RecA-like ATPase